MPIYKYRKVSRQALEELAKYSCEQVGGTDDCPIINRVRDEARTSTPEECYERIGQILRTRLSDLGGSITIVGEDANTIRRLIAESKEYP